MASLRLFERPPETPPGLDRVRAWLRKPRPRLRGVWLWIRWILSGIPATYRYVKKKWPAAREQIRRVADEGEKVARAAVRIGHAAQEIGGGIVRSTRALRGPDGKVSGAAAKAREVGRAVRGFGGRLKEGSGGVAAALSSVRRLIPAPADKDATGLGLLDPPANPTPEPTRAPVQRARKPREPDPPATPATGTPTLEEPRPELAEAAPAKTAEPAPEPDLAETEPAAPEPGPSKTEPPAPVAGPPEKYPQARFRDLPRVFLPQANAVGDRPHPTTLRALILEICRHRDWTTPAQLARWFDMHRRSLSNRHIRPLLEAGLLERRFPDRPNSPKQAYRTRREDPAPPDAGRPAS